MAGSLLPMALDFVVVERTFLQMFWSGDSNDLQHSCQIAQLLLKRNSLHLSTLSNKVNGIVNRDRLVLPKAVFLGYLAWLLVS
jgi:hypothetical protein